MAMCTTIVSIRDKNIRHLYSGTPCNIIYRTSADYPNLDQLRLAKMDKELRENILKSAKQSYAPAELEPAAAFRCVSAAEAEEIGNRLYAGHRKKNSDGEPAAKNGQGRGTAAAPNKQSNQSVKFHKREGETPSAHQRDSTPTSPTPLK